MKHSLAAAGLAAGLVAGGAAGLVLVPAAALGQTTAPPATGHVFEGQADERKLVDPGEHLREVLAPLVANGTITQAQADKVIAALREAGPLGKHGPMRHRLHIALGTVAKALGMTEEALRTELRSDKSIADVARSKGIAPQAVVDALVAEAKARLDKEVAAGDLTQAEADARLTKAKGMFTSLVNGDLPKPPGRRLRGPATAPGEGTVEESVFVTA